MSLLFGPIALGLNTTHQSKTRDTLFWKKKIQILLRSVLLNKNFKDHVGNTILYNSLANKANRGRSTKGK